MERYSFKLIEKKWQIFFEKNKIYRNKKNPKFYLNPLAIWYKQLAKQFP